MVVLLLVCFCLIAKKNKNMTNKIENTANGQAAPGMEMASNEFSLEDVDQAGQTDEEGSKQKIQVIGDGEKVNKDKDEESLQYATQRANPLGNATTL